VYFFTVAVIGRDLPGDDFAVAHHVALVFDDFEMAAPRVLYFVR